MASNGSLQTVYNNSNEACTNFTGGDPFDLVDGVVDAFKYVNSDGQAKIQMNFPWWARSRRLIGDSLATLKRENTLALTDSTKYRSCIKDPDPNQPTYPASGYDWIFNANQDPVILTPGYGYGNPSGFANRQWLTAPYLVPGTNPTVYAMTHNEFHGVDACSTVPCTDPNGCNLRPGPQHCWMSTVTLAKSDGSEPSWDPDQNGMPNRVGAVFVHPNPRLIAAIPYQYHQDAATCTSTTNKNGCFGRQGYTGVGNVIKKDGYYYALIYARQAPNEGSDPHAGTCVLRTTDLSNPGSWGAWNGHDYSTTLKNPYQWSPTQSDPASDHLCAPISLSTLGSANAPRNIRYDTYLRKFVLLTPNRPDGDTAANEVLYSLSDDLVNWSPFQRLFKADSSSGCMDPPILYPSLLDPNDPAKDANPSNPASEPNFNQPTQVPWVWFPRGEMTAPPNCSALPGSKVDLVYQPIKFKQRIATFEDHDGHTGDVTDSNDNPTGFDSKTGSVITTPYPAYEGARSAEAFGYAQAAYGSTNVSWNRTADESPDVWYGSAFYLPSGFHTQNRGMPILRWNDPDGNSYGGIVEGADGLYHLGLGTSASGAGWGQFGLGIDLSQYEQNWVYVDVHQRFDSSHPLSEVYVNGKLATSTTQSNTLSTNSSIANQVDYGITSTPSGFALAYMDQAVLDASQRAPVGAPDTPLGLRQTSSSPVTLTWNAVTPKVTGDTIKYSVYRCDAESGDGWVAQGTQSGTSWSDDSYVDPSAYRVTAVESAPSPSPLTTEESDYSAPLNVAGNGDPKPPANC